MFINNDLLRQTIDQFIVFGPQNYALFIYTYSPRAHVLGQVGEEAQCQHHDGGRGGVGLGEGQGPVDGMGWDGMGWKWTSLFIKYLHIFVGFGKRPVSLARSLTFPPPTGAARP